MNKKGNRRGLDYNSLLGIGSSTKKGVFTLRHVTSKLRAGGGTFLSSVLTEIFGELGEETRSVVDLLLEEFESSSAPVWSLVGIIIVIRIIIIIIALSSVLTRSLGSSRTLSSIRGSFTTSIRRNKIMRLKLAEFLVNHFSPLARRRK